MGKWPIYFGYAGAIPFVIFMIATMTIDEPRDAEILTFLQLSYAAMIVSFLGGIHWGQAIPRNDNKQMTFAMIPTIVALLLMIWTFMIDPILPLFGMSALFWIIYKNDLKLMPIDFIPEGYFSFRKRLTIIVCTTLIISALITIAL